MQLYQAVEAYKAAEALMGRELDYKSAYALVTLHRQLRPHVDFFLQEEMKLVQRYGKKNDNGVVDWTEQGQFRLEDEAACKEYVRCRRELGELEITPEVLPVTITAPDKIKPSMLAALEGFVIFREEVE